MILLDNVVEIFALADGDRGAVLGIVAHDRRRIGPALVDVDRLGQTVTTNGPSQETLGRLLIALIGEQKVNRLAEFIDSAVQIPGSP